MKFILTAAILATAFTQFTDIEIQPAIYNDKPIKTIQPIRDEPRQNKKKQSEQMTAYRKIDDQKTMNQKQQKENLKINDEIVEQRKDQKKLVRPMFGEQQFNPSEFKPHRPERYSQKDDFVPHPQREEREGPKQREGRPKSHGRPNPTPMPQNWEQDGPSDQIRSHEQWRQQRFQDSSPFAPGWEEQNHKGQNNHKKNKKLCIAFFITAVIFTLFGLCLGKCARRCKKNRKERLRHILMRSVNVDLYQRTSAQIYQEIQETERKANELKSQYRNKKAEEERLAHEFRRQEEINFQYETQMRNVHYPQRHPQVFYAQQPYQVPRATIPVGRPLNETNNSSFVSE